MASRCMSTAAAGCIDPAAQGHRPVRATYANLYKWPESDAEFVRSVANGGSSSDGSSYGPYRPPPHVRRFQQQQRQQHYGRYGKTVHPHLQQQPRVVDSLSCRQMFLRSYTFTRKETVPEKARKCLRKARDGVVGMLRCGKVEGESGGWDGRKKRRGRRKKRVTSGVGVRRLKEVSCSALCALFRRLLSCTSSVDVVDDPHRRA